MLGDHDPSREPASADASIGGLASSTQWVIGLGPYVFMIVVGVVLYHYANLISYTAIPGQIGPELWPKIILILFIAVCAFEIVRRTVVALRNAGSMRAAIGEEDDGFSQQMEAHPVLVLVASAATVAYLLLFDTLGFFTATLFYVASLMWIGGVHRPLFVAMLSVVMSFSFSFFFLKLIYVALPLGEGPFAQISLLIMKLVGVN